MSESPVSLRQRIGNLKSKLRQAEEALSRMERDCRHQWTQPKHVPEYREAYTIPGDRPGTMGVDWRGPSHVPAKTINRWERKCLVCGKTEVTERTRDEVKKSPVFPGVV